MSEEMMPDMLAKAENGDVQAQYRLGIHYKDEKNYLEAAKWLRFAAAQGHSDAQNELGLLYANGHLEPDDAKAVEFFRLAAEQGNMVAQNNLGFMLENGRGVAKSRQKAEYWYKQSAAQGFERAKNNLASLNDPKLSPLICPFCHFESERGARVCKGCLATITYPTVKEILPFIFAGLVLGPIIGAVVAFIIDIGQGGSGRSFFGPFITVSILFSGTFIMYYWNKAAKMREEGDAVFSRRR